MSGQLFEYFFESAELEPYYSELIKSRTPRNARGRREESDAAIAPRSATSQEVVSAAVVEPPAVEDLPQDLANKAVEDPLPDDTVSREVQRVEAAVTASAQQPPVDRPREAAGESRMNSAGRTRVRNLLSVHALGQYVFCPRSAILAIERGDEQDVDEPLPRLSYLPNFDRERIEELLKQRLGELALSVVCSISMLCLMVAGMLSQNKTLFYPAMFVLIACLMWCLNLSAIIFQLAVRRQAAINAKASEPDPQFDEIQKVNWWSMLKAGFEPVNYQRPFQHPELPLEGCPWRVLERGSQRIPVIRSGADKLGGRKGQLFGKHQIRLVAYALLLEATGHEVPYGLVFPQGSPRGLAMPITHKLRAQTSTALEEFALRLRESQERHIQPSPPENRNRCGNCRHGQPEAIRPEEIENASKAGNTVVVLLNGSDKAFHCECGDRFGTAPPHRDAIRLGLRAALQ